MQAPIPAPGWPARYIGEPYVPREHDCWAFARRVWREVFGFDVPAVNVDPSDAFAVVRALAGHPERARWSELARPREAAAVLMTTGTRGCHVGVWSDCDGGGVLHCLAGCGVVWSSLPALALHGWRVLGFYERAS